MCMVRMLSAVSAVSDQKISVIDLVIRAVAVAHQQVPEANVI